jgi:peptide/nickel transport system permease protein
MVRLILLRLAVFVPSLLVASVLVFGLTQLVPGGAAESLAGPDATPEVLAAIRERLGTDRPLVEQYFAWAIGMLTGNPGVSYQNTASVGALLAERAPVTFELATWALIIAILAGGALGIAAAMSRGRFVDRAVLGGTSVSLAVPEFWVGMLALGVFAVTLGLVPAAGFIPWSAGVGLHLQSIVLPVLVLALAPAAIIARITRSAMVDVLQSPYIRTSWATGVPATKIYFVYGLKNIAISVITVIGLLIGTLLGGTVLVEQVFTIPGLGSLLLGAALAKDVPVMQAAVLLVVTIVLTVNLLVDLSYAALDPRTRTH